MKFNKEFVNIPFLLCSKTSESKTFAFSETPLKVYEGETNLKIRVLADKTSKPGKHNLSATLRVQACDEKVCYAPGALAVTVPVNVK